MSATIVASSKSFGVYTRATPPANNVGRSSSGMMPPTTIGTSSPAASISRTTSGTSWRWLPDRIEIPTRSTSSSAGGGRDLRRGHPDALVDDLHSGVAGGDGDLFGAVRVTVEPGLADEHAGRAAGQRLVVGGELPQCPVGQRRVGNTSRAAVLAEHLAERTRPLASGHPGPGAGDGGRHDVRRPRSDVAELTERVGDSGVVALAAPVLEVLHEPLLHCRVDALDRVGAAER